MVTSVLRMIAVVAMALTPCLSHAAPIAVDLSRSHTLDAIRASGLVINPIAGGAGEQDFSINHQEIEVVLPSGRRIRQAVELGLIDSANGVLSEMSLNGDLMPHDQALLVARAFHESFGLSVAALDKWDAENRNKQRGGTPYGISANLKSYPRVSLSISPTFHPTYPWFIILQISWDWRKHQDWNEERAWRELPVPAMADLSLNPPSGLKYDPTEYYRHLEPEPARQEPGARQPTPDAADPAGGQPATPPRNAPGDSDPPRRGLPWFWLVALALLLGLVLVIIRGRSARKQGRG